MAITSALATSYKKQLLEGVHDHRLTGGDAFYMALYTSTATMDATTTTYTTTNEVTGTGYTAGGKLLTTGSPTTSTTTAFTDFEDLTWTTATITARGCMIYNSTPTHTYTTPTLLVRDFGADITSTAGDFTVGFGFFTSIAAVIRLT